MNRLEEWNLFVKKLQESTLKAYSSTYEYELRKTRQAYLDDMMSNELTADQRVCIEEILVEIISFHNRESALLYQQGMKDCVWLLRNLGVLL